MENIIDIKHLTKSYGRKTVINNLTLSVKKGEIFGLLGHNGTGKSTTIDCTLGIKKFEKGTVNIFGQNPVTERKKMAEKIGVQFQQSSYQEKIRVGEICSFTSSLYKKPLDWRKLLCSFALENKEKQEVADLSGGERQKLSVLLALLPDPELVFLDELTTGLDSQARRDIWKYLKTLHQNGMTIMLTSHYMDEVEALCDRICILRKDAVAVTGKPYELIERSPYNNLEETYLWYANKEDL